MENSKILTLLVFCQIIVMVNASGNHHHHHPLVPALYVFGDSTVDAGNNNHLNTVAKANGWPYGIDFNNVTGRNTNAKTIADFAAIHLGLPLPPAYLNLSDSERSHIKTGINYASGACGILNTTRVGGCLSMEQQIIYFTSTVTKDLPKQMNRSKLQNHLAKSIFLLSVGLNDYNILANGNITSRYTPQDYADYLLDQISKQIQKLYELGGRKFVVSGLTTCEPHQYIGERCETRYYRDDLPETLLFLQAKLPGSFFTIYDNYRVHKDMLQNHEQYGITNIEDICYNITKDANAICEDRSKYYYFDKWHHRTQAACEIAMEGCFNGTFCTPYNLFQLANINL